MDPTLLRQLMPTLQPAEFANFQAALAAAKAPAFPENPTNIQPFLRPPGAGVQAPVAPTTPPISPRAAKWGVGQGRPIGKGWNIGQVPPAATTAAKIPKSFFKGKLLPLAALAAIGYGLWPEEKDQVPPTPPVGEPAPDLTPQENLLDRLNSLYGMGDTGTKEIMRYSVPYSGGPTEPLPEIPSQQPSRDLMAKAVPAEPDYAGAEEKRRMMLLGLLAGAHPTQSGGEFLANMASGALGSQQQVSNQDQHAKDRYQQDMQQYYQWATGTENTLGQQDFSNELELDEARRRRELLAQNEAERLVPQLSNGYAILPQRNGNQIDYSVQQMPHVGNAWQQFQMEQELNAAPPSFSEGFVNGKFDDKTFQQLGPLVNAASLRILQSPDFQFLPENIKTKIYYQRLDAELMKDPGAAPFVQEARKRLMEENQMKVILKAQSKGQ